MRRLIAFAIKAAFSAAAISACGIVNADFSISNEHFAIGIDDSNFLGNMLSELEGVGGRLDTDGPHDFWFDGFEGFARTTITIRNQSGTLLAQRNNGLSWFIGPTVSRQTQAGSDSAVIEGEVIAGVFMRRVIRIEAGTKYARITDTFTNNTGAVINPGVLDNVNPISPFFEYETFNDLRNVLGTGDFACATIFPDATLTVGFGSNDLAYRFSAGGGQALTSPFGMAILDPNGALGDQNIQAGSIFGEMLPGSEHSHTWYMSFGSSITEAENEYVGATGASTFEIGPVGNQFIDEHIQLSVSVPVSNPGTGSVSWSVDGPPGMMISPTGNITWTPGELDGGNVYPVEVEASNGTSTATTSFDVTVIETNTAPVIDPIADISVNEGDTAVADANGSDSDIPIHSLTYELASGPAGASVNLMTGEFSWATDENDGPGSYPVTIRVRDNGPGLLTDETTFTVSVEEINEAPTVDPISDKTVSTGANLTFTANAEDPDLPANVLTFSLDPGAPAGATIDPMTGVFDWTPGPGSSGDHTIVVRVTDNGEPAMSDTEEFMVTVEAPALVITYDGDHSGEYTDPTTLSVRITDNLNNPIPGLDISFTLGTFVGSDTTDANGEAEVTTILDQPAGNPGVTVSFAGNGTFDPFTQNEAYAILREKVIVTYFGDEFLMTGTNLLTRAAVRFYAEAFQENDGYPGVLTGQALVYNGFLPGNTGSTPDTTVGPAPIDGNGRSAAFKDLAANHWSFDIEMAANGYWRVAPATEFEVKIGIGVPRESSGNGWVPFGTGNGHGKFNFRASYTKKKIGGSMSFEYQSTDGFKYMISMTQLMEGGLTLGANANSWKSAITGLATVKRMNLITGQVTTFNDVPFTVDAWDGARSMPVKPDAFGILLLDANGYIWLETPDILNIGGGSITIK